MLKFERILCPVDEKIWALLVFDQDETSATLRAALEAQSIETSRATDCRQAARFLEGPNPPHLVFTDAALPDGTWADVLSLASRAQRPVNVIVVSRIVDIRTYLDAIECGALDYIVPPFASSDLAHVVRCAAGNAFQRRNVLVPAA